MNLFPPPYPKKKAPAFCWRDFELSGSKPKPSVRISLSKSNPDGSPSYSPQSGATHGAVRWSEPSHGTPPYCLGSTTVLVELCCPVPQRAEHGRHWDQLDHSQSTRGSKERMCEDNAVLRQNANQSFTIVSSAPLSIRMSNNPLILHWP